VKRVHEDVYDLYQRGSALLESGDYAAAAVPLKRARELEPDKASIREALGRALFHTQRFHEAAREFQAVVDQAPTTDYALFCLGRCLQLLGRHAEARVPLAMAASLCPKRSDYALYRDRAAAAVKPGDGAAEDQ
jgi:Flp pilus assembly protein TadD